MKVFPYFWDLIYNKILYNKSCMVVVSARAVKCAVSSQTSVTL